MEISNTHSDWWNGIIRALGAWGASSILASETTCSNSIKALHYLGKIETLDRYQFRAPYQVSSAIEHSTDNRKVSGLIPLPGTKLAPVTELVYVYDLGS